MTVPQSITPRYLPTSGAATYLSKSISYLEKMRGTGDGPLFAKLGGSVVYKIEDLDSWVASRTVKSTSQADTLPNISTDARSRQTTTTPSMPTRRGRPRKVVAATGDE